MLGGREGELLPRQSWGQDLQCSLMLRKDFFAFVWRHLLLGVRLVSSATLCALVTKFLSEGLWGPRAAAQSKPHFLLRAV